MGYCEFKIPFFILGRQVKTPDMKKGTEVHEAILSLRPNSAKAWYDKAMVLFSQDRYENAIEAFDRTLELDSSFVMALNHKGLSLVNLQRYSEAIEVLDKAIASKPDFYDAMGNMGLALYETDRYPEALETWKKAVAIKHDYPEAWLGIGMALCYLGKHSEALAAYDELIKIRPDYGAWYFRGLTLSELGKFEEAIKSFDKALELRPGDANAMEGRERAMNKLALNLGDTLKGVDTLASNNSLKGGDGSTKTASEIKLQGAQMPETLLKVKDYLVQIGFTDAHYDSQQKAFTFRIVLKDERTGQDHRFPIAVGLVNDYVTVQIMVIDLRGKQAELSREKILEGALRANFLWPEVSYSFIDDLLVSVAWSHKDALDQKNFATEFQRAVYGAVHFGQIVKYAAQSETKPAERFPGIYG